MHRSETNMNMMKLKAYMRDEDPPSDDYVVNAYRYSVGMTKKETPI